jgi:hypothetical protein
LLALIVQVTGVEADNRAASLTLSCIKALKVFASFDATSVTEEEIQPPPNDYAQRPPGLPAPHSNNGHVGLNLSYTINLNLPATADQAVFNAIFRSLKEHLLSGNE